MKKLLTLANLILFTNTTGAIIVQNHSEEPVTLKIAINCAEAHQGETLTIPTKSTRYVSTKSLYPKACLLVRSRDHSESAFTYKEVSSHPHTLVMIQSRNGKLLAFSQPD